MNHRAVIYLIPSLLDDDAVHTIPAYLLAAVKECEAFFVENERTARRFLKRLDRQIVIDNYTWMPIGKAEQDVLSRFEDLIERGMTIGIISEAGCPGVADPGQSLVKLAHELDAVVKPLVGPSSILLALMASGMNGQQFRFVGYLPIENSQRARAIKELETESAKKNCTQVFIETPYRNQQLIDALISSCEPTTRLCIAADLTSDKEFIRTMSIAKWKVNKPQIHKHPAIFLLYAGTDI